MKKSEKLKEGAPFGTMTYLSKAEAAEYLRISSRSLMGNIELGWLPAHSLPSGEIIFRRDELDVIVSLNPFIPLEKMFFSLTTGIRPNILHTSDGYFTTK